jgi:hypothetical protein
MGILPNPDKKLVENGGAICGESNCPRAAHIGEKFIERSKPVGIRRGQVVFPLPKLAEQTFRNVCPTLSRDLLDKLKPSLIREAVINDERPSFFAQPPRRIGEVRQKQSKDPTDMKRNISGLGR